MRRSYAGVSKVLLRCDWESSLQTRHEHGRYDGWVQAAMRCPLGRVR